MLEISESQYEYSIIFFVNHQDTKDSKDFIFYLIRATDQVNHHALTGNNSSSLNVIYHSLYAVFH